MLIPKLRNLNNQILVTSPQHRPYTGRPGQVKTVNSSDIILASTTQHVDKYKTFP